VSASPTDLEAVRALIDRVPKTDFIVVARDASGGPIVIKNAPFERDGTPMPTRYWLVGRTEIEVIGRLEASGGVRRAEAELEPELIEATHERHRQLRDADIPEAHTGHRPSGGVGGTRRGVKCLHAHYACWLAGEPDVIGQWVVDQLGDQLPPTVRIEGAPGESA
jgi:uncharacterized protein